MMRVSPHYVGPNLLLEDGAGNPVEEFEAVVERDDAADTGVPLQPVDSLGRDER